MDGTWRRCVPQVTTIVGSGGARRRARVGIVDPLATAYLRRLGLDPAAVTAAGPSAAALRALHQAHVERVPYETIWIALGRGFGLEPRASAERIAGGWGGYCYHLNGAFGWLLTELGYAVTHHRGGVHQSAREPAPGATGNHVALTVEIAGQRWLVDVGLGDGLWEPIPLERGEFLQGTDGGPTRFRLRRSEGVAGWRLDHDPRVESFAGMDFVDAVSAPGLGDFGPMHTELSTDPASMFVRWVVVVRRDAQRITRVRNCLLSVVDADGARSEVIRDGDRWWHVVESLGWSPTEEAGAPSETERQQLWARLEAGQREWEARADVSVRERGDLEHLVEASDEQDLVDPVARPGQA